MNLAQRQGLVEENIGLAFHAANTYVARYPRLRDMIKDLEQEAFLGLVQAAEKYDVAKGKFGTYAWYWASARIRDYVHASVNPVSGMPNTQRGGRAAVFVPRVEFIGDTMGGVANTDEELLDAPEVASRFRDELVAMVRARTQSQNPERDVDLFLTAVIDPEPGSPREDGWAGEGMTRQRIEQIRRRVRPLFADLVADYRGEAA